MSTKTTFFEPKRVIYIVGAALVMAINIKTLVQSGGLLPGGATGLTLLIQRIVEMQCGFELPFTIINILLNAIPVFIGFKYIGKKFTLYSCLMMFLTGFFADLIPAYNLTNDTLLAAVFGGLFNGAAISIALSAEASAGGTDFIAIYLSEKKHVESWNLVLGINAVILTVAGLFFGWDKALYSIIFQYVSIQMIHVLFKRYQKETLFVVTQEPEKVCQIISDKSQHGATIINAEGAHNHSSIKIVYSVVAKDQYLGIVKAIREQVPDVFINTVDTESLTGRFFQKKAD